MRFSTHLIIITGRGDDRQRVEVKRNLEADSVLSARVAAFDYARSVGLSVLLDDTDARVTCDTHLGNGTY